MVKSLIVINSPNLCCQIVQINANAANPIQFELLPAKGDNSGGPLLVSGVLEIFLLPGDKCFAERPLEPTPSGTDPHGPRPWDSVQGVLDTAVASDPNPPPARQNPHYHCCPTLSLFP